MSDARLFVWIGFLLEIAIVSMLVIAVSFWLFNDLNPVVSGIAMGIYSRNMKYDPFAMKHKRHAGVEDSE